MNELEIAEKLLEMVEYTHLNIPKLWAAYRLAYLALDQVRETMDHSPEATIRLCRRIFAIGSHRE